MLFTKLSCFIRLRPKTRFGLAPRGPWVSWTHSTMLSDSRCSKDQPFNVYLNSSAERSSCFLSHFRPWVFRCLSGGDDWEAADLWIRGTCRTTCRFASPPLVVRRLRQNTATPVSAPRCREAAVTLELKKPRAKQTKSVYIARTAVTWKLFSFHVSAVRAM